MPKRNNLLLVLGLAALGFLAAIPMQWFTLINADVDGGGTIPLLSASGLTGTVTVFFKAPIWLLLVLSTLSTGVVALNVLGKTSVPRLLPLMALVFCGVHYIRPFFLHSDQGQIGAGPFLAVAATVLAVIFTFVGNRPMSGSPTLE